MSFLLLPSPLLGPSVWFPVAETLRARGHAATVAGLPASGRTPLDVLASFVEQARAVRARVLVPHSNAGLYAPAVAAAVPGSVAIVFVDAGLPVDGGPTGLAPSGFLTFLEGLADPDGLLPPWTRWWPEADASRLFPDGSSRRALEAEQASLPLAYFRSTMTAPAGWSGRAFAYLAFGSTYAEELERTKRLGWPTRTLEVPTSTSCTTPKRWPLRSRNWPPNSIRSPSARRRGRAGSASIAAMTSRWWPAAVAAVLLTSLSPTSLGPASAVAPAELSAAGLSQPRAPHNGVSPVPVPPEARAVDTSHPTRTIGNGTAASCTSAAVVRAVAAGGIIRFACGSEPVTIHMSATAKVVNSHGPRVVLDGRGLVTLDGGYAHRILYMDTCDPAQDWTTSHCDDQNSPRLVVQNLTFAHGNSTGHRYDGGGGGAIFARGGRVKIVNTTFVGNRCERHGPDIGGGAVRVLSQYHGRPVYVVNSRFSGGVCSNGSALSSIGVSWVILNSRFTWNRAVGHGANPPRRGSAGGGSGGAIYLDGNRFYVSIRGALVQDNVANEGGGAVFFVSNDRTGTMSIAHSTLQRNPSKGFETAGLPGIFFLGAHRPTITHSILR